MFSLIRVNAKAQLYVDATEQGQKSLKLQEWAEKQSDIHFFSHLPGTSSHYVTVK